MSASDRIEVPYHIDSVATGTGESNSVIKLFKTAVDYPTLGYMMNIFKGMIKEPHFRFHRGFASKAMPRSGILRSTSQRHTLLCLPWWEICNLESSPNFRVFGMH
jgi:hypothetical protein